MTAHILSHASVLAHPFAYRYIAPVTNISVLVSIHLGDKCRRLGCYVHYFYVHLPSFEQFHLQLPFASCLQAQAMFVSMHVPPFRCIVICCCIHLFVFSIVYAPILSIITHKLVMQEKWDQGVPAQVKKELPLSCLVFAWWYVLPLV